MVSQFQTNRIMTPAISNPVVSRPVISRRQKLAGPNHHLWFNHGTWWIHYTIHLPDHTATGSFPATFHATTPHEIFSTIFNLPPHLSHPNR